MLWRQINQGKQRKNKNMRWEDIFFEQRWEDKWTAWRGHDKPGPRINRPIVYRVLGSKGTQKTPPVLLPPLRRRNKHFLLSLPPPIPPWGFRTSSSRPEWRRRGACFWGTSAWRWPRQRHPWGRRRRCRRPCGGGGGCLRRMPRALSWTRARSLNASSRSSRASRRSTTPPRYIHCCHTLPTGLAGTRGAWWDQTDSRIESMQ